MRTRPMVLGSVAALLALTCFVARAGAATIRITTADDYHKIEAAVAGDTVIIAAGTYKFRVHLEKVGTAAMPIIIKAEDPTNPPVWDLAGMNVEAWPGSYTGGDNGRGCWQVAGGAYYDISGLILKNCHTSSQNAAGLRFTAVDHLTLRDILFQDNEHGLSGDGTAVLVEHCEMDHNGQPAGVQESHSIYIYGGDFTLRYSYVHDATHGQNFHLRCGTCTLESNWIARAQNYEGDLMPGTATGKQTLIMRGNVIIQNATPENNGQIIAPYNDTGATGLTYEVILTWNTIIGNGGPATLLQFNNAGLDATKATISNNVIVGLTSIYGSTDAAKTTVTGSHNWMMTGAMPTAGFVGTIFGAAPGLDAKYRPTAGSAVKGVADATVTPAPTTEYFQDETTTRMYRARATAADLGAFESTTTGPGIGAYGGGAGGGGGGSSDGGAGGGAGGGGAGAGGGSGGGGASDGGGGAGPDAGAAGGGGSSKSSGCGCRLGSSSRAAGGSLAALAMAISTLALVMRHRRTRRET